METDFIYWRHHTPVGIKVEEVCGGENREGVLWREMAIQVYCENGRDGYREIGHYENGAPFNMHDSSARISITHTKGLLAVAQLPKTPECDLRVFNERSAMGIDAERLDREQVIKLRPRFLTEKEMELTGKDVAPNIIAWTAKEAMYKAAMTPGLDFRTQVLIESLPSLHSNPVDPAAEPHVPGKGIVILPDGQKVEMTLYSYESEGCCVTLAFSPRCAKNRRQGE